VVLPLTAVSGLVHILALQKSIGGFRGSRNTLQQSSDLIFFASSGFINEESRTVLSNRRVIRQRQIAKVVEGRVVTSVKYYFDVAWKATTDII
jgi:hypothetical protein